VAGASYCFALEDLGAHYFYGIEDHGAIDISGAEDQDVTPATCKEIVGDLTPETGPDVADGPPRTKYWSERFTKEHEAVHIKRHTDTFFPEILAIVLSEVQDPSRCTVCKSQIPTDLAGSISELFDTYYRQYFEREEIRAHAISNPSYITLIQQIRARARRESTPQNPWPQECQ
jgi:hypothetical protein